MATKEQSDLRKMQPHKGEPAGIKKASLIQRIITGAIFAVVVLAVVIFGSNTIILPMFCMLVAAYAAREFYRLARPKMSSVAHGIGIALAVVLPAAAHFSRPRFDLLTDLYPDFLLLGAGDLRAFILMALFATLALFAYMTWMAVTPDSKVADITASFFGALYVGIPLACLVLLGAMNEGFPLFAVTMIVSIWAADSFAYLGGSLFGRHKLAPVISPKKSWEGLFAGTIGAILMWYLAPLIFTGNTSWVVAITVGILVSLTSLIGDLFESRVKRERGVKDSGTLLPGHGGVLDRFDSLFFTTPVVFLLLAVLTAFGFTF